MIEITGALAGLIVSIIAQLFARSKRIESQRAYLSSIKDYDPEKLLEEFDQEDPTQRTIVAKLLSEIGNRVRAEQTDESDTNNKIAIEIEEKIEEIKRQVQAVESRFPNSTEIDKYASVNDAIFNERLDQFSKRIERIESKMLSQWDVAIVVSSLIGGAFAVVAATYAVLEFLNGT
tara:strand:- start:3039 stop:3566 length:528 start_codon:yes stop_codon:yes gene_type:complete